ncbi:hypothetical protein A7U60_g3169 [Sanghuangporus baumii]|uniref:Uncharacterized protein n=1 Tax=Sanghuangporus baumii TaxID=108892 RepID=A0A9Q5I191_SANBA|nr:hypothetical protein A7U60_g3169 [Sanghuangporus baumii]
MSTRRTPSAPDGMADEAGEVADALPLPLGWPPAPDVNVDVSSTVEVLAIIWVDVGEGEKDDAAIVDEKDEEVLSSSGNCPSCLDRTARTNNQIFRKSVRAFIRK